MGRAGRQQCEVAGHELDRLLVAHPEPGGTAVTAWKLAPSLCGNARPHGAAARTLPSSAPRTWADPKAFERAFAGTGA